MLLGDKSLFAIEWEVWKMIEDKRHYCFQFWGSGISIGQYEDTVMDSIVIGYMKEFLGNEKTRRKHHFSGKDATFVYNVLFAHYYGTADTRYHQSANQLFNHVSDIRAVFHLGDLGGNGFIDHVGIVSCFDSNETQRLVWKEFSNERIFETCLPGMYIEKTMHQFLALEDVDTSGKI